MLLGVLRYTVWNWLSQKWEQHIYKKVIFFPGSCHIHFTNQFLLLGQIQALFYRNFLYLLGHEIVSHIQIPSISELKWYMPDIFLQEFRDKEVICSGIFFFLATLFPRSLLPRIQATYFLMSWSVSWSKVRENLVHNTVALKWYCFHKLIFFYMYLI